VVLLLSLLCFAGSLAACGATSEAMAAPAGPPCKPLVRAARWRHRLHGGRVASLLGSPRHVVTDVLAGADQELVVSSKFAYGKTSKDVEDETVELWQQVAPCKWKALGRQITDDDGRARFTVSAKTFDGSGPHTVRVYLLGDRSYAEGKVWIVAAGMPVVLFDIDGTLTADDGELFEELLGGTAQMQPGADAVARRWADLGYLPIYITGRPYPLRASTFAWLGAHRFPLGPVFTVDSLLDFLPGEGHVGEFKLGALRALMATGIRFHRAYGNASTDVCAYARAGIAPENTFIVGALRAGCDSFPAPRPLPSYVDHLPAIGDDQRVAR
jgi:phosphatidate phosphatase PAH1